MSLGVSPVPGHRRSFVDSYRFLSLAVSPDWSLEDITSSWRTLVFDGDGELGAVVGRKLCFLMQIGRDVTGDLQYGVPLVIYIPDLRSQGIAAVVATTEVSVIDNLHVCPSNADQVPGDQAYG